MDALLEGIKQKWLRQGLVVGSGVSEREIKAFEAEYHVVLPADFRLYLAVLNGLPDAGADNHFIFFWPLERIISLAKEYPGAIEPDADQYFIFADWSISCHEYVIHLSDNSDAAAPVFVSYNLEQPIASSFSDFMVRYLNDDRKMLFPE